MTPPSFAEIRDDLRAVIQRNLEVEARRREIALPSGLAAAVAASPESRHQEIAALFEDEPPLALVHFDTPGLQEYIFRVRRPVDLLGGSRIVAAFTDPARAEPDSFYHHLHDSRAAVPESCVIYAGGGGGLLLVAACEADGVAITLRSVLAKSSAEALATVSVWLAVWPADLSAEAAQPAASLAQAVGPLRETSRYAATIAALMACHARERSRQLGLMASIPPERHIERCRACGGELAEDDHGERTRGEEVEKIGPACMARWRFGLGEKNAEDVPWTFEDLVDGSSETAIAVLYADGANAGSAFQSVRSPAQHRALSRAVDDAMNDAQAKAQEALADNPKLGGDLSKRVLTVIHGGDDLVIILPAIAVFEVIPRLVACFEGAFDLDSNPILAGAFADAPEALRRRIGKLGLGIGVAIAEFHFPIQFLLQYASELLKSAKSRIHDAAPEEGVRSAVDFLVLRSGTPLSHAIRQLRQDHFARPARGTEPRLQLTRRPYSIAELQDLIQRIKLLGQVPPSQLHTIRREIDLGFALSRSLWRYQHARAAAGLGWGAYREALACPLADVDRLLWEDVPGTTSDDPAKMTSYLDALEIFDYVNPDPAPGGGAR